ncbi:Rhodanese domain protein [Polychytrium aggregatum]|uniref:Rhodanese domain protein n=1 Tax=Polychytrium aggregatum TaxID=110093 RepID=UPI0022FE67B7|nr:Rhodanese domain protein [Polychytrium aggregatum]KAI9204032.1 Rhodanese domain protein [Polychytrium aggregatum]
MPFLRPAQARTALFVRGPRHAALPRLPLHAPSGVGATPLSLFSGCATRLFSSTPVPCSAPSIVSTQWLKDNLSNVVVVDGSWYPKRRLVDALAEDALVKTRDPLSEYLSIHIQDARFFDIDTIADPLASRPRQLPSASEFAAKIGELGIKPTDHVVVYDTHGIYSSPRVWWTFKVFGHENVSVLDGGLFKWVSEGNSVTHGHETFEPATYKATYNPEMVIDHQMLLMYITDFMFHNQSTILDARLPTEFSGRPYHIPGTNIRNGHVPSAVNLPYGSLVQRESRTLISREQLQDLFTAKGIDTRRPFVAMCGNGIVGATLMLVLDILGAKDARFYPGGWEEWASNKSSPIKTYA